MEYSYIAAFAEHHFKYAGAAIAGTVIVRPLVVRSDTSNEEQEQGKSTPRPLRLARTIATAKKSIESGGVLALRSNR
jgi:hypothetical protein